MVSARSGKGPISRAPDLNRRRSQGRVRIRVALRRARVRLESGLLSVIRSGGCPGEWRNGRRAGFRCQCPSGRGGSSPPSPTTSSCTNKEHLGHELERGRDLCVWWGRESCGVFRTSSGTWAPISPPTSAGNTFRALAQSAARRRLRRPDANRRSVFDRQGLTRPLRSAAPSPFQGRS